MSVASTVSPPDISAVLTNLGIFSLAVAAVIGGIYKAVKDINKSESPPSPQQIAGGLIVENSTLRSLTESNTRLYESNGDITRVLRDLCHKADAVVEALADHREITRSQMEVDHRLRAVVADLVDVMRRTS